MCSQLKHNCAQEIPFCVKEHSVRHLLASDAWSTFIVSLFIFYKGHSLSRYCPGPFIVPSWDHGMARYHWHHAKPSPSLISPAAAILCVISWKRSLLVIVVMILRRCSLCSSRAQSGRLHGRLPHRR